MALSTPLELSRMFIDQVQNAWTSVLQPDTSVTCNGPPQWIMGIPLNISVILSGLEWDVATMLFKSAAKRTNIVHSHWVIDNVIYAKFGYNVFKSTRTDVGPASKTTSIIFNEPFDSVQRLQLVVFSQGAAPLTRTIFANHLVDERQLQAHFLRFSLRLNSFDIFDVIQKLEKLKISWTALPNNNDYLHGASRELRTLMQVVLPALRLPVALQKLERLPSAMGDMRTLKEIGAPLFAVSRNFGQKYAILMHLKNEVAQRRARHLAPSFLLDVHENANLCAHVHVLTSPIARLRNIHVISFKHQPSDDSIEKARRLLRLRLHEPGARPIEKWPILETAVFQHDVNKAIFRLDGIIDRQTQQNVLNPLVKAALGQCDKAYIDQPISIDFDDQLHEPRTIVIWTRQSLSEKRQTTSIPRQLWTVLTSECPPLMSLQPCDRVLILVEYCSSSSHPVQDRVIASMIPHDRPRILISTNPDRVTRRSLEIALAVGELNAENGEWWSQGAGFDEVTSTEWFKVSDYVEQVQEQVDIGRECALQQTFNSQATAQMNRLLAAKELDSSNWQISALKQFVRLAVEVHRIRCFIIIVRESPTGDDEEEEREVAGTLVRQSAFLSAVLPDDVDKRYISLPQTSGYSGKQVIHNVRDELQLCEGRAMLVSTSLDRVSRSRALYKELRELLREGGHMAISYLWDAATSVKAMDAMLLPTAH